MRKEIKKKKKGTLHLAPKAALFQHSPQLVQVQVGQDWGTERENKKATNWPWAGLAGEAGEAAKAEAEWPFRPVEGAPAPNFPAPSPGPATP